MKHLEKEVLILSPFEMPDVRLVLETIRACAFPVLHLGRDREKAKSSLQEVARHTSEPFGVCVVSSDMKDIELPDNVTRVIVPYGMEYPTNGHVDVMYQIHSMEEAQKVLKEKQVALIIKGYEGAGKVGNETSFTMFQRLVDSCRQANMPLYIQGGAGVHSSAAYFALGAKGVILDAQVAAFPECSSPKAVKEFCMKQSGSEPQMAGDFRFLTWPVGPTLPREPKYSDIEALLGGYDLTKYCLVAGQDVTFCESYVKRFRRLKNLVYAIYNAAHGHLLQAKERKPLAPGNSLTKTLNLEYPIAQGPMARVSDVPEFLLKISDAGAMPMLALSNAVGDEARSLLSKTKELMAGRPWGVGFFGFSLPQVRSEQTEVIIEARPDWVLIAGGRPSLAKPFEDAGLQTLLHVPSSALLDMFIKEGARHFVFEGRESGGHIGPLSSIVLWEKQIFRLMEEIDLTDFTVFFAGGIHDAFSSAFVNIMTASLAARGVKLGAWIGTAYLFTPEVVETGAITPTYQDLVLKAKKTVYMESSPGMVSRVVETPIVDFFYKEKQKLIDDNVSTSNVQMYLENIVAGRLRIAAKGLEFKDSGFETIPVEEQIEKGIYMTGEISSFLNTLTTIPEIHKRISIDSQAVIDKLEVLPIPTKLSSPADIAVIGMDCIMPQARDIEEFWRNIYLGLDCMTEIPDSRMNKKVFYHPGSDSPDHVSCKVGGYAPSVDFDPMEFGMTPLSVMSIEPAQLLGLIAAKRALRDAGYLDMSAADTENISVIIGCEGVTDLAARVGFRSSFLQIVGDLPEELEKRLPHLNTDSFAGFLANIIPGRISNRFNLRGRNYGVTTACASSLTALYHACMELNTYEADMVVAGGNDFHNNVSDFLLFHSTHALSKKGFCNSFDAESDGMTMGEGVGLVILKRLEDAERDGDHIYAVIKGVGGSSDGKAMGITAPTANGQVAAMQKAYQKAGISPAEVGMIEAHGTGTVVGDRTEIISANTILNEAGAPKWSTSIGSVKSQIGHGKTVAGIAGFIKAVMAVYNGVIPPTINLRKPVDVYQSEYSPLMFNTHANVWTADRRVAGVSAFGFGGANFHVVVENYHPDIPVVTTVKHWPAELFLFRGDTMDEALQQVRNVQKILQINDDVRLKNIAYTLAMGGTKPIQVSVVANKVDDLLNKLEGVLIQQRRQDIFYTKELEGKVAFLFTGQGSQYVNMARDLFVAFPGMRKLLKPYPDYQKLMLPPTLFKPEERKEWNKTITDTRNAQPLLGIVDYAIATFLRDLGIVPDMVGGHSYGELPALCFAGAFDENLLVDLSRRRAESILGAIDKEPGKMAAVNLSLEDAKAITGESDYWAVNFNSPTQTVVAGTAEAIDALFHSLQERAIPVKMLNVACAFHSPLLAKAKGLYSKVLKKVPFNDITLPVWSNTTAQPYPTDAQGIKDRLAEHLVKPVLFTDQMQEMYNAGARVFIEAGPGGVLTGLAQTNLGTKVTVIQTERAEVEGIQFFLEALAKYVATGRTFDFEKLFVDRNVEMLDLENPEKYAKGKNTWRINGQFALPNYGNPPRMDSLPFETPIYANQTITTVEAMMEAGTLPVATAPVAETPVAAQPTGTSDVADAVVLEYLDNVKTLIESQRDVLLGYFGQSPEPHAPRTPRISHDEVQVQTTSTPATRPVEPPTVKPVTQPTVSAQPAHRQATAPVSTGRPLLTRDDVKNMLLSTVGEKTGYPAEMLGMDMDLEAELSIDSIKRMEIVGELRDRLELTDVTNTEDAFVAMAALKTLNELVDWIMDLRRSLPQTDTTSSAASDTYSDDLPYVSVEDIYMDPNKPTTSLEHEPQQTATNQLTVDEIKVMLVSVVSEKTGYPSEMLGFDLDLEADLSIDSIKRMEIVGDLKEKLGMTGEMEVTEEAFVQMAALKTLNELVAWIAEKRNALMAEVKPATSIPATQQPAHVAPQTIAQPASIATAPAPSGNAGGFTLDQIKDVLVNVVSEKTGYPIEMLGFDLDLEADLSIDSIKRMEIVAEVKERLNLTGDMEATEEAFIQMAALKSLNELSAWVDGLLNGGGKQPKAVEPSPSIVAPDPVAATPVAAPTVAAPTVAEEQPVEISRILMDLVSSPVKEKNESFAGKHFALTVTGSENSLSEQVKVHLEKAGAVVDNIQSGASLSGFDGLIVINASEGTMKYTIEDLFNWIKGDTEKRLHWIYSFSDVLGEIAAEPTAEHMKQVQGFTGLFNTLRLELPDVVFRSVMSHTVFDAKTLPQIVADELCCKETLPQVVYKGTERLAYVIKLEDLPTAGTPHLPLTKDSVVIVLGGAQGISPAIITKMAETCPCRYILVGRTKRVEDESSTYITLKTKADIRQHLIKVELMRVPIEVEKKVERIYKSNQIAETIGKISRTGATVTYKSLDVTDKEAFRSFLQQVRKDYGHIDGIIHAAGLLRDKFFADKTWEMFEQVYSTKINPLHVIMDEMQDDVKLLVLFSSIASSYGNVGQSDYSSANSVYDMLAPYWSKLSPGLRTLTVNWGPWKSAGMVSEALEAEFNRRGVALIPLKEGSEYFIDELKYGNAVQTLVMGGKEKIENFLKSLS